MTTSSNMLEAPTDPAWSLQVDGYDPLRESTIESRFAISNGFLGVRGARSTTRGARWVVPAHTYIAGLFDTLGTKPDIVGLVPAADWLWINILLPDGPLVRHPGDVSSHRITLDMQRGVLVSNAHHVHASGVSLHVRSLRLVSLATRAIGLQLIEIEVGHGEVDMTFEALFEGMNLGLVPEQIDQDLGVWRTEHSLKGVAMATAASLQIDGRDRPTTDRGELRFSWTWKTRPGQIITFQRLVAITCGAAADPNLGRAAREQLRQAQHIGWQGVIDAHQAAWAGRWACSDVQIGGDEPAQQALRFALYHLNSAANPADEHVSIGARGLTGADYHGHVFWDTEIFLLPFYTLTWPEAARALLMYRFHTLPAAVEKAARMGWRGALYAWESADTGDEMTPEQVIAPDKKIIDVLCGRQEQHISSDVAYAVWHYWQATGDEGFLLDAGAEILLETGRFWCSRANLEADGRHHIRGVIGPDEYHEHIDDNAYTNIMARWNIRCALDVAALLRERWPARWKTLSHGLELNEAEMKNWLAVAQTMATGTDPETGLVEQFAGYFKLEDIDLTQYTGRSVPMDVVLGRDRIQQSQIVKQPDVVALLGLLPDEFSPAATAKNFHYYEPRCSHGSSLSPAMHGLVAARLGEAEMALRFFRQTAEIDLGDTHVAIDGGVHIAALGGLWLLVVSGFAGVALRDDGIAIEPNLPLGWNSLAFSLQWRGRHLNIGLDQTLHVVELTLGSGDPMIVTVSGQAHQLICGRPIKVPFTNLSPLAPAHKSPPQAVPH